MPGLVSDMAANITSNLIDKLEWKKSGKGTVRAGRGFTYIKCRYNDIIKIAESLGKWGLLIDGATETENIK